MIPNTFLNVVIVHLITSAAALGLDIVKYTKVPNLACDATVGSSKSGLSVLRCLGKAQMNDCWAVGTSPDCQCCETTVEDPSTAVYVSSSFGVKKLGEACINSVQCPDGGILSDCVNGICACNEDQVQFNTTLCLPIAGLGNTCIEDVQCSVLSPLGGICDPATAVCSCDTGFTEYNATACIDEKIVGDVCNDDQECAASILNGTCNASTNLCDCEEGMMRFNDTTCILTKVDLGGACMNSTQCPDGGVVSSCVAGICTCNEGQIQFNTTLCLLIAALGEPCIDDVQCSSALSPLGKVCDTTTGVCACSAGFTEYNSTACIVEKIVGDACNNDQECAVSIANGICNAATNLCDCAEGKMLHNGTTCVACLPGWLFFPVTSRCYFYDATERLWADARDNCAALGGELTAVRNREENDFVYNLAKSTAFGYVYFGGNDFKVENDWEFLDGTKAVWTNFNTGQPAISTSEQCLGIRRDVNLWHDLDCSTWSNPSVCSSDPTA